MVPFSIILWASFTHERPPFRAAGLAPAARYASALRAVCQELRGRTGLALLGKHAVIGHELFACFDLDGDGFLDLRNGEKVGFRKIRNDAVGPAAEAAGQSIKEYVTQAIQERMERER